MKKLINDVETVLAESLDGFAAAHAGIVGHGMLDAACPGQVFTSPTPNQMLAAAQAVDGGVGVLFMVKNYSGDMMNFEMAAEMLERDNATVIVNDDVALTPCTVPAAGKPTFQIGIDEMEMGVGIHGEPGRRRVRLTSADEIAAELTGAILKDLSPKPGQEVILLVNGFGGTPLLVLYVMVHAARKVLAAAGGAGGAVPDRVLRHVAGDGGVFDEDLARNNFPNCFPESVPPEPVIPFAPVEGLCAGHQGLRQARTGGYATIREAISGQILTVSAVDEGTLALWDAPVRTAALRWGV